MKENPSDDRQQLLEQFVKEISSGTGAVFYDEDDLIELYDYASDIGNDFVRFEVLMCGSRLYPSSVPLAERKAFYLYREGYLDAAAEAMKSLPETSLLKKMLGILLNPGKNEKIITTLDRLLEDVSEFEDEEVIQLVHVAASLGHYSWITDNYSAILSKCSYQQSFLFELLNEAESHDDFRTVVKAAEELTLLEPFNEEFWIKLAEAHINNIIEVEKGLSYLDYALAINPKSVPALLLKARGMYHLEKPVEEVIEVLESARMLEPDNFTIYHLMAWCLLGKGYNEEAVDALYDYLDAHPDNLEAVETILGISNGRIKRDIISPFFTGDNSEKIDALLELARELISDGEFKSALLILESYDKHKALGSDVAVLMELLYRSARYSDIVEKWQTIQSDFRTHIIDLVFVLSCVRINRMDLLDANLDSILAKWGNQNPFEPYSDITSRLGSLYIFTLLSQSRIDGIAINIDECDPFSQGLDLPL
ncbi:MAG: hypothetical protein K2H84_08915 [Paramuribaculum sp.]|nr:hypothetical protein [Paramuribaculum sp.]